MSSESVHLPWVPAGEELAVVERLVVAPELGVFRSAASIERPAAIEPNAVVGYLERAGSTTAIASPFGGLLVGMLAHDGERVRPGQPVAWLRVHDGATPGAGDGAVGRELR